MSSPRRIVICGGGAIGAAIAYFISLRGARPIVIERYEVGGAVVNDETIRVFPDRRPHSMIGCRGVFYGRLNRLAPI